MGIALPTIAACLAVSLCSLSSAIALWLRPDTLKRIVPFLVALAVGVLLGDAFIHLIPDAVARHGSVSDVSMMVLIGLFVFFVLEKLVRWRHDHNVDTQPGGEILPLAKMNLIGDAMHNFVDGILIAGSFLADPVLGLTTTLAIIAHEIPQELGDVGALLRGGYSPRQAVLYNFYCSLSVLPGALFTLLLSQVAESSLIVLLPIAAGGFIYIAASDLIPVLHERSSIGHVGGQSLSFALGIVLMQGVILLEQTLLSP
ncbi:MAG: ZIP family metal transporter [Methylomonas sp.]|nr:MAG: ZIP family metal transporter [Methylomonas sp.]PPD27563.1 MAG: ZIP family metal transporter [Methylomonas sp.]PPD39559.1 MAG: ZIP family metal transporter [Methylomonas sp.]PPD55810.1 MAG: ZIP family metal transporter [Methylomonas sp.]